MDFSSVTETQQQQQQAREQQQSHYPPQSHAYDAYYGYHQQHYDASASHHPYYYPYDYATAYHQQQLSAAPPQDFSSAAALHPGPPDAAEHQDAGPPGVPGYARADQGSYSLPPGLNPAAAAAVAALSQLSQFAGTMDAAERAMAGVQGRQWHGKSAPGTIGQTVGPLQHNSQYPAQHRGMRPGASVRAPSEVGGRRGGRPFRGGRNGGRAKMGHYSQGPNGGAPFFRGRGRGTHMVRGRGRRLHQSAETSVREPESTEMKVSGPAPVAPVQPRLPVAWCDICRVDCNSLEILEQHKSGKRHKRTVKRFEEIQAQQRLLAETQAQAAMWGFDETTTQPQPKAESQEGVIKHPEAVVQVAEENRIQVSEQIKTSTVSGNSEEASACENTMKSQLEGQVDDEQKVSAETEGIIYLPPAEVQNRGRPPKRRMMRFGRGGKRVRYFRPIESRPKERFKEQRPKEQPRVCTLCNVMCETQVVFNSHIAGKKHISRIKRFQGEAAFGPLDAYIPPNQPSMYNAPGLQPLFFGLQTQEMIHLAVIQPSSLMDTYGPHQRGEAEPALSAPQAEQGATMEVNGQSVVTASEVEEEMGVDLAGTATEHVAVEAEAACKLIEHVVADNEVKFENVVEADTTFAFKGDGVLAAETSFNAGEMVEKADTV